MPMEKLITIIPERPEQFPQNANGEQSSQSLFFSACSVTVFGPISLLQKSSAQHGIPESNKR
jgi:hypothetical protein